MRDFSRIQPIIRKLKSIMILTHRNSDLDAICSASALRSLLMKMNPNLSVAIGTPEGVNKVCEKILSNFEVRYDPNPTMEGIDMVFTVDTNNFEQLGTLASTLENLKGPIIMVDHHYPHPSMKRFTKIGFCDDKSTSTCEIICHFYKRMGIKLRKRDAELLLVGILFETRHLRLATSRTLLTVVDLIKQGVKVEDLYPILELPMDDSERMARLRSAQRARILRSNGSVIVTSEVGSHQASAARALITLGADLAAVGSEDGNQLKLSLRSTREFYRKHSIHLGRDLAKPLGDFLNGTGGGHSLAAGVNGSGKLEDALRKLTNMIKDQIERPQLSQKFS